MSTKTRVDKKFLRKKQSDDLLFVQNNEKAEKFAFFDKR